MKNPQSLNLIAGITLLVITVVFGCKQDDPPLNQTDEVTYSFSSERFDYYISDFDANSVDSIFQESYLDWVVSELEVDYSDKIEYYKYRDRAHLTRVTSQNTNAFADYGTNRLHTIWPVDNHEITHLIIDKVMGRPPALFDEGMAVAHQASGFETGEIVIKWNGENLDDLAKAFLDAGKIPNLDNLLETYGIWMYDTNITYPVAGSFMSFLINNYGITTLKAFLENASFEDEPDNIKQDFLISFGTDLEDVWQSWLQYIHDL